MQSNRPSLLLDEHRGSWWGHRRPPRPFVRKMTRSYGTGSLTIRRDKNGGETWYGQVRSGDRKLKRALGPTRMPGSTEGLTGSDVG